MVAGIWNHVEKVKVPRPLLYAWDARLKISIWHIDNCNATSLKYYGRTQCQQRHAPFFSFCAFKHRPSACISESKESRPWNSQPNSLNFFSLAFISIIASRLCLIIYSLKYTRWIIVGHKVPFPTHVLLSRIISIGSPCRKEIRGKSYVYKEKDICCRI